MFNENDDDGIKSLLSIQVLFSSFVFAIVYFVWKSTNVRELNIRGIVPLTTNSINLSYVRRSSSLVSNVSTTSTSEAEENLNDSVEQILAEATSSFRSREDDEGARSTNSDGELTEEELIIQEMDGDSPSTSSAGLRRRHNAAMTETDPEPSTSNSRAELNESVTSENSQQLKEEERISIKLKYLNDEIKTVSGYLNETIGNFKRRQFNSESESKLIKLIFNGQILEDDKKSLSQCGIFSDAVVHCLILQKRNVATSTDTDRITTRQVEGTHVFSSFFSVDRWNAPLCIYLFLIVVVTLTLSFCWYCRIQYSNYFSWYSTIGLIVMTSIFIVSVPLLSLVSFVVRSYNLITT